MTRQKGASQPIRIERQFRSGDGETRAALREICDALNAAGLDPDDLGAVELVLAEVLNNVTEHAYADGEGPVALFIVERAGGLACRIRDRGHPMPRGELPAISQPVVAPPDILPEGGFGWHIIRCLTSDLQFHRTNGWNDLCFVIPVSDLEVPRLLPDPDPQG